MDFLRRSLARVAAVYRFMFWAMMATGGASAVMIYQAIRAAHLGQSQHATIHWPHELPYCLAAFAACWFLWNILGRISARMFSYIIDYSDVHSFSHKGSLGPASDNTVRRYTNLYRRWK